MIILTSQRSKYGCKNKASWIFFFFKDKPAVKQLSAFRVPCNLVSNCHRPPPSLLGQLIQTIQEVFVLRSQVLKNDFRSMHHFALPQIRDPDNRIFMKPSFKDFWKFSKVSPTDRWGNQSTDKARWMWSVPRSQSPTEWEIFYEAQHKFTLNHIGLVC